MLLVAATLWLLWTAFLVLPLVGAPRFALRAVSCLLGAELLALAAAGYGGESCAAPGCSALAETARAAAHQDVPVLSVVLLCILVAHGVRARAG